jgi:glycosyltransferase involved in cell wall biosynthesis
MGVLHCVPSLDPRHGGPSQTVAALTDALARTGALAVALLAQGHAGRPVVPAAEPSVARRVLIGRGRVALALGLPMRRGLAEVAPGTRPALIHSHGVWHPAGHWAALAARRWQVPLILHPRGMLEPWALGQKAWKKRLALTAFQRRDLSQARVLVATSALECDNLRTLGLRQPVAVIPNGVALPAAEDLVLPDAGAQAQRERLALFLSRVHPKKGVLALVRAWAQAAPRGWRLVIAGPDEGGHAAEVARLVTALGLDASVVFAGAVAGSQKAALYRDADLFVLPTFSENFGLVVAEALSYGVPVITTRGAPWADLETHGCGWWIDTGVEPLVAALRAATALTDSERQAMGERGRAYVQRYDWDAIAAQTLALYRWVLGQGERPGFVRVD